MFDGTHLYEHAIPGNSGAHPDWGTLVYTPAALKFALFISNVAFLLDKYHIDGLRV